MRQQVKESGSYNQASTFIRLSGIEQGTDSFFKGVV